MKTIISRLTMKKIYCSFVDEVSNREVFVWVDVKGQKWLAETRFGFRIKTR